MNRESLFDSIRGTKAYMLAFLELQGHFKELKQFEGSEAMLNIGHVIVEACEQHYRAQSEPVDLDTFIGEVSQNIAELPDRNSPEDWPEAMLVTHDELKEIITAVHAGTKLHVIMEEPVAHYAGDLNGTIEFKVAICNADLDLPIDTPLFAHSMPKSEGTPVEPEYFSIDDGDYWFECPDDSSILDCLVHPIEVGAEYEVAASYGSFKQTYRVVKVPDEKDDDYLVELVSSSGRQLFTTPQPTTDISELVNSEGKVISNDDKLPVDVRIAGGTVGKGCKFETLLIRIDNFNKFYDEYLVDKDMIQKSRDRLLSLSSPQPTTDIGELVRELESLPLWNDRMDVKADDIAALIAKHTVKA